jgi:predicted transcriptional regulator
MLSLPDDWDYTENGLVQCLQEGRSAIRATLKELADNGYLQRQRERRENGTLGNCIYTVYEHPNQKQEKPMLENPTLEKPTSEKQRRLDPVPQF